jgi:hypothetical protein
LELAELPAAVGQAAEGVLVGEERLREVEAEVLECCLSVPRMESS